MPSYIYIFVVCGAEIGQRFNLAQIRHTQNMWNATMALNNFLYCISVVCFPSTGAPLGEFVVWSDLIASLHILGHDITVVTEFEDLSQ